VLGVEPGASIEECTAAYDLLSKTYDPRRHPVSEQQVWITWQNVIDEAMSLIADSLTFGASCGSFVGKGSVE